VTLSSESDLRSLKIGSTIALTGTVAMTLVATIAAGVWAFDATLRGAGPAEALSLVSIKLASKGFLAVILLLGLLPVGLAGFISGRMTRSTKARDAIVFGAVMSITSVVITLMAPANMPAWIFPVLLLLPVPVAFGGEALSKLTFNLQSKDHLLRFNEDAQRPRRTHEAIEHDREVSEQFAIVTAQRTQQSEIVGRLALLREKQEREKSRADSTARMRAIARAAFMSHPAASAMDFERCWPEIKDELFKQHTIELLTESVAQVDDMAPDIQRTSTQSVLRLASSHPNSRVVNLLSTGGGTDSSESELSPQHHTLAVIGAARDGNVNKLRALADAGANLDVKNGEGWTALMTAALKGHVEVARLLVVRGASLDAKNNSGWTALRFASSVGDIDMMALLIEYGADVDSRDDKGWTILMQAADEGNAGSVKLLLASGADREIRNFAHESALSIALRQGHADVVHILKKTVPESKKQAMQ
jgi:hypothetical protein